MESLEQNSSNMVQSPFIFVIFGATGDLAHTKLIPALFSLYKRNKLPQDFFIIGFARREFSHEEYRDLFITHKENDTEIDLWNNFAKHLFYKQGMFDQQEGYDELVVHLQQLDVKLGACITRIFYLATPPENYETILTFLQKTKLSQGCGQGSEKWTKIAIEKPFGKNLLHAKMLDKKLSEIFKEEQIFRVDHYLAKETIQNMLTFRFANGIFEPIWNATYIDHVQVTWGEKRGIETRGKFYDGVGMLRDVAQNHLMQIIAAISMEQPKSFSKEAVREVRAAAIKAITLDPTTQVVRGQYKEYTKEKDVIQNSQTETFVALKVFVDTPRFQGVPFYLRAGKKMPQDIATISIVFKQTCHVLFKEYGCPEIGNVLTIHIHPNEGIELRILAKKPDAMLSLETVNMKFSYKEEFGSISENAYEKLLLDIFHGDQLLFNRSDELDSSWKLITNILSSWENNNELFSYSSGTWGPAESMSLIEQDGKKWLLPSAPNTTE